ncbi:MAG: class I SAM-dependent RNA methyltransferase [Haliscomenobacter sp.]
MDLLIKTMAGLEEVLAAELQAIGAQDIKPGTRSVQCSGDLRLLYRANLELRTALRILVPIRSFTAFDERAFYLQVGQTDWSEYLDTDDTFAIDAVVRSKYFTHSQYVGLKTKDAIVDQFRERTGRRPSVDTENPNVRINIHISESACTLSLDSTGESLHRRGYRKDGLIAPINETLAAGMLLLAGYTGDKPFVDPMCGSGTLPIEAAMIAMRIPPQLYREHFLFMRWPNFDPDLWADVRFQARAQMRPSPSPIFGFDKNFQAVQTSEAHAKAAHLDGKIHFERRRIETLTPPAPNGIIVSNPPYDARITDINIEGLYTMIGDRLKKHFIGYEAWIISANQVALKHLGLRPSSRYTLYNGALECKFIKIELYEGSKRLPGEDKFAQAADDKPLLQKKERPRRPYTPPAENKDHAPRKPFRNKDSE